MVEIDSENNSLNKAAILLLTLENSTPGIIKNVINVLGKDKAKKILERISKIGKVSQEKRQAAVDDFYSIALENEFVFGGIDVSSKILKESFGINKAKDFFRDKKEKFQFLKDTQSEELIDFLTRETDQMKLFIMNFLSPRKGSELIDALDDESLSMKIMTNIDLPNLDLLYDLEIELAAYFNTVSDEGSQSDEEYLEKLASTLEFLPDKKREGILQKYNEKDPEYAKKLMALIFTFEDFNKIIDYTFRTILFEISDFRLIALAKLNCSAELVKKIDRCLTDRTKSIVESEGSGLEKKASNEQIEDAKRKIVGMARMLEKKGAIKLYNEQTE